MNSGTTEVRKDANGMEYMIHIPENVNKDTSIFVYEHGSEGKGRWGLGQDKYGVYSVNDSIRDHGSEQIIIAPFHSGGTKQNDVNKVLNIVNGVRSEYGITNPNLTTSGFSAGGYNGLALASANIASQQGKLPPQTIYMIDDYSTSYDSPKRAYQNASLDNLKQNNSIIFMFEDEKKYKDATTASATDTYYAQQGLNVVRVSVHNDSSITNNPNNHSAVCNTFFQNNLADYNSGKVALPETNMTYRIYNSETGTWEQIDYNQISTIDKAYEFFNIKAPINNKPHNLFNTKNPIIDKLCTTFNIKNLNIKIPTAMSLTSFTTLLKKMVGKKTNNIFSKETLPELSLGDIPNFNFSSSIWDSDAYTNNYKYSIGGDSGHALTYAGSTMSLMEDSAIDYVTNYVGNKLTDNLSNQLQALESYKQSYERYCSSSNPPDPIGAENIDISSIKQAHAELENKCQQTVKQINNISNAIKEYDRGNWSDGSNPVLNEFSNLNK